MHSIKNISERNKIDTQSRADAYIRRKRLISKRDYNLKHLKVFLKLKNPKNSLFWENVFKKTKKPKKPKNPKKPTGLSFFFYKSRVFSNPAWWWWRGRRGLSWWDESVRLKGLVGVGRTETQRVGSEQCQPGIKRP
jgi:hypothetical protein